MSQVRNPFPDLRDVKDSMFKIASLRKDLMIVDAELIAKRQARRAIFGAIAGVALLFGAMLGLFWLTRELYDAGWEAWRIALLSVVVFGAITAIFAGLAYRAGFPSSEAARAMRETP